MKPTLSLCLIFLVCLPAMGSNLGVAVPNGYSYVPGSAAWNGSPLAGWGRCRAET